VCESEVREVQAAGLRHLIPGRWWEKAAGLYLCTFKPDRGYARVLSLDPEKAAAEVAEIRAQGFQAIEIFAPAEGRFGYAGLDMTDPYRVDPELGTMEGFRRFVRLAHCNGVAVVIFLNIGYFSVEAPAWLEACADRKAGRDTEKVRWFSWADTPDAPPPSPPEDPLFSEGVIADPDSDPPKTWGWQHSDLAGCYYWARWQAKDDDGNWVGLPQLEWGSPEWPQEAERIVRFWMATGIDGMIIDAPGCYSGLTWEVNNRHITGPIAEYGNAFIQAEGVHSLAWLTEGGCNCLQNYGLSSVGGRWQILWSGWQENSILSAIRSGDPRPIEQTLGDYRDLAADAGGVLYTKVEGIDDSGQRRLQAATIAGIGDMLVYGTGDKPGPDAEEQWLLRARYEHPALHQLARRRRLPANADHKYYAFLKTAQDGSERVLVALNFQPSPQTVEVDVSGVATAALVDLKTGERFDRTLPFHVELPAYGYAFLQVLPPPSGSPVAAGRE
jgi:hypothetical protein